MSRLRADQLERFVGPLRDLVAMFDDGLEVEHAVRREVVGALRGLESALRRLEGEELTETSRARDVLEGALRRVAFGGPSPDEPDRGFALFVQGSNREQQLGGTERGISAGGSKAVCEGDGCSWTGPPRPNLFAAREDWIRHALDCEASAELVAEAEQLVAG